MIAGRFHGTSYHGSSTANSSHAAGGLLNQGGGGSPTTHTYTIDPRMIASEIVREYKENLEQAESGLFGDDDVDDDEGGLGLAANTNTMHGGASAAVDGSGGGGNGEYLNNSKNLATLHVGLGSGDRAIEGENLHGLTPDYKHPLLLKHPISCHTHIHSLKRHNLTLSHCISSLSLS